MKPIPSGRGIAAMCQGIWIINIYAPSDAEKRMEREYFLNKDVTFLVPTDSTEVLIAGDFNCVIFKADYWQAKPESGTDNTNKRNGPSRRINNAPAHPRLHTLHKCRSDKIRQNLYHQLPRKPQERSGNSRCSIQRSFCSHDTDGIGWNKDTT